MTGDARRPNTGLRWLRILNQHAEQHLTGIPRQHDRRLALALDQLDPITARPDPDVIATAMAYARRPDADPEKQLLWGRYAYTAASQQWGPLHPLTLRAASIYQRVLAGQGLTFDAVRISHDRLAAFEEAGDICQALASRCRYAVALHRDGQCDLAERQITTALRQWWASPHGHGHAATVLLAAAAVHAGCGRTTKAAQLLHRDAAHLTHLSATDRRLAAHWLAIVTHTHPAWCNYLDARPPGSVSEHRDSWLHILTQPLSADTDGPYPPAPRQAP